jgi:REP element-mobilizing transposase RayT
MTTNVLIINRQLVFAVTIKQALEQTGAFEVHPFTSPDAALDFIRSHPHDVALIDFTLPDGPGIVRRLRALQPEIAVIVSPTQPNSGALIRELGLQGMIDAPFSARGIIPLIEHAVEQIEQPLTAITRSLNASDDPSSGETELLSGGQVDALVDDTEYRRSKQKPRRPKIEESVENLPGTRQLSDPLPTTNILSNDAPPIENLPGTRQLSDPLPTTNILGSDVPFDENLPGTRQLPGEESLPDWLQSRLAEQPMPWAVDEDDKPVFEPPVEYKQTQIFDDEMEEQDLSPSIPKFSTLDSILSNVAPSEMFEPQSSSEDTPSVPSVDSGAIRQFLATKTPAGDDVFGSVLDTIPEEMLEESKSKGDTFEDLVKSMRNDKTHTPLPDRHQQFIDFILTGGMEDLLTEIEKHKTGPLPALPNDDEDDAAIPIVSPAAPIPSREIFEKLAQEEPPMPTLEESGTVGDLMLGVSDTGFRNVLAMMQGEEVDQEEFEASEQARTTRDIDEAFRRFFDQEVAAEVPEQAIALPPPPMPVVEPPEESPAIPAQLILETALDESTPIDSFSLSDLINNIERQLSEHTPEIQPPPSWGISAIPRPKSDDRYIKEPDFLPEEFPTAKTIQKLPSWQEEDMAAPRPAAEIDWSVLDKADTFDDASVQAPAAEPPAPPTTEVEPTPAFDMSAWDDYNEANAFDDESIQALTSAESPTPLDTSIWDDMAAVSAEYPEATSAEDEQPPVFDAGMWDDLYQSETFEDENYQAAVVATEPPAPLDADIWDDRVVADEENAEAAPAEIEPTPTFDVGMWDNLYEADEDERYQEPVAAAKPPAPLDAGLWDDMAAADEENLEQNAEEFEQPPVLEIGMWDDLYDVTVQGEPWSDEAAEADDFSADLEAWNTPPTSIPLDMSIDESVNEETVMMRRDERETFEAVDLGQMADFEPAAASSDMNVIGDDPYIAQIALSLTQVSLELTAEATILTRDSEIVASAGQLSGEEIAEFGVVVADDWSAGPDESRIRFITLPSNSKGYMLYSRRTAGDFTLSMIFADTTPLRDIRRQGKRLTEALDSVPDVPSPVAAVVDASEVELIASRPASVLQPEVQLTPYSYVWLLRDDNNRFNENISRAIRSGLTMQLREQGWKIKNLEAHDEYIYLVADVPGEQPAHEVVNDLKRRTAEIAHMQDSSFVPQSMWADSYLIMTPGRELHPDEIGQFIQFERMF